MTRLANVLLAGTDRKRLATVSAVLHDGGYDVVCRESEQETLDTARHIIPDVIVIDLAAAFFDGLELARRLRDDPDTGVVPVAALDDGDTEDVYRRAQAVGVQDVFEMPAEPDEMRARLAPLVRLSCMRAELRARARLADMVTGRELHAERLRRDESTYRVLVIGGTADTAARLAGILAPDSEVAHSESLFRAADMMTDGRFDAALLDSSPDGSDDADLGLCTQVRNNPRLFNLPMVLLAEPGRFADRAAAYRRGASLLLPKPVDSERLRASVAALVDRQRLRWAVRGGLDATRQPETLDAQTDTYDFNFLFRHLENRIEMAFEGNRFLTLVFFSIPNLPDIIAQFGDAAETLMVHQLAGWINRLIRAEDLCARHSQHIFCVILPDTPVDEARIVMQRIAGVLGVTEFHLGEEVCQAIKVWVEVGMAEYAAGDSAFDLIARVQEDLR